MTALLNEQELIPCSCACNISKIIARGDLKEKAITLCSSQLTKSIKIMQNVLKKSFRVKALEVPHNLFHWEMKYFNNRIQQDPSYISTLQRHRKDKVQVTKMCIDLEELGKLVGNLTDEFNSGKDMEDARNKIKDYQKLSTLPDNLRREYQGNLEKFKGLTKTISTSGIKEFNALQRENYRIHQAEGDILCAQRLVDPILHRYTRNYYLVKSDERESKFRLIEDVYRNDIITSKDLIDNEKLCFLSTYDVYSNQIAELKLRFEEMSENYEKNFEKLDDEIVRKRLTMKIMKDQIKSSKKRIEIYHMDIEEFRIKDAERVQREEEALMRESSKKKKKGKKRNKKKVITK